MSSRRTLEQALPIIPWQQALRGLRASQTTSLWGMEGGDKKQAHVRACGKGGGGGGSEVSASPPLQSYLAHRGDGEGGVRELRSVCAPAPPLTSSGTCWPERPRLPPNRQLP